jgi:hypothetical protein
MKRHARPIAAAALLVLAAVLAGQVGTEPPKRPPGGFDDEPPLGFGCDWEATVVGDAVLASLRDPANLNYCTPPPFNEEGIPLQHAHPITGERVGSSLPTP